LDIRLSFCWRKLRLTFSTKAFSHYADVFDLSRYAERVEGIGAAQKFFSPFIARKDEKLDWIPENIAPVISWTPPGGYDPVQFELGDGELDLLTHHVETASREHREVISVPGWPAPIRTEEAGALVSIFKEAMAEAASGKLPVQRRDAVPVDRPAVATLQIKGNIDATDYAEQRGRLLDFDTATSPELPDALLPATLLKTHQSVGVAWLQHLWRLTPDVRGCIFADDMGLGKTLQMLTLIAWYLQTRTSADPVLIVAPVSLLENWNGEIRRFFRPGFASVLTLAGNARRTLKASEEEIDDALKDHGLRRFLKPDWIKDRDIVLTTYETMRDYEFSFSMVRWGIMVCDEAQKIKTPSALVTRAAKAQNARFKIACTGTPVENSLSDLWCLFDFAQPGLLGALNGFCKEYRRPIEAETEEQKQAVERLRRLIEPQILRRMKHEVADLPPKTPDATCRSLPLSSGQAILYTQSVDSYRARQELQEKAASGGQGNVALLGHLHKLRMICAAPPAPDLALAEYCRLSPKMAWLIERLRKIRDGGEKVIIFTEFRDIQRMLQRYVGEEFGIRVAIVNGDTSVSGSGASKSRQGIIDAFQSSAGFNVIILSTTAVGFGVNVQAANHVIHYTRSWNPAKEDQATDRAYRIGQDKQVFVYCPTVTSERFITFEAKLDTLLEAKRRLAGDMLNGADDIALREWENVALG
jgi:SNF2 family DNA or RNA helicase